MNSMMALTSLPIDREILLQLLSVRECLAYGLAKLDVGVVNGIKCNQLHLLNIGLAILGQILLVTENVHDFCNEVVGTKKL